MQAYLTSVSEGIPQLNCACRHRCWTEQGCQECLLNYCFQGGDGIHLFNTAQRTIKEWGGECEEQVLIDRVADGLKPVASLFIEAVFYPHGQTKPAFELPQGLESILLVNQKNELEQVIYKQGSCLANYYKWGRAKRVYKETEHWLHLQLHWRNPIETILDDWFIDGQLCFCLLGLLYGYPIDNSKARCK